MADTIMTSDPRIEKYLSRNQQLQSRKDPWNPLFQRLAEVFLNRKADFTSSIAPGDFLYKNTFDNTGEIAAMQAASVYMSMLWPDSSRTFVLRPVDEFKDAPGVEEHFRYATKQVQRYMDAPRAGLLPALQEFEIDQQVFGTSGVATLENDDESLPVVYEAWNIKGMRISENAQGFVDMIFYSDPKTVRQVVEDYKLENVSAVVRALYADGKYEEKVEVLKVIEPRALSDRQGKAGMLGMPIRTLHIDVANKTIMKEGGYQEMPVAVGRAIKTIGEELGRSNAMMALPDALSMNCLKEAIIRATEKQLDPPLGVLDDGRLGGGTIDTSAGALNVFNASGRMTGDKPVFPLFTVGELQSAEKLMVSFKENITQAFGLDRLLDLNNSTQMTAFETSVRNRMRGESLGAPFARQIAEVFTPTIERTVSILYRKGLLGMKDSGFIASLKTAWAKILGKPVHVIPKIVSEAIEAGLDVYEVEYISPAQRFMQSEKLQGIFTAAEFFQKLAVVPGFEAVADLVDVDATGRDVIKYSGAPSTMARVKTEVDAIRKGRAEAQMEQAKMEQMKNASEVARNAGSAAQSMGMGNQGGM
jgi:hypothetical protein